MKRVLLLTDPDRDLQTQRALEQITLGLAGDYEFSEQRVAGGSLVAALGQFARLRRASASADLVHAWGHRALRLASLSCDKPILYTPLPDDPPATVRWLLSAMHRRTIRVISLSEGEDRLFVEHGVPAAACILLRPGIRISRQIGRDDALRSKLQIAPEAKVVLLVGESRPHADHPLALHALSLLAAIDPALRVLYLGAGPNAETVENLHDSLNGKFLINARRTLGDEAQFEDILRAADAGVIAAPDRLAVLPILACMASGLPLVAPATRPVSAILEDRHTGLLYSPRKPRTLAQRILMLLESPQLALKLADQSRAEAYELYSVSRFLDEMRRIYE